MSAVRFLAIAELRRSWRAIVALALLVALLGGVVLAFAAGARRTASAYPRLRERTVAADLLIGPGGTATGTNGFYDAIAALPGVRAVAPLIGLPLAPQAGTPYEHIEGGIAIGAWDDTGFRTVGRPKLLAGRMPDPQRGDEALASRSFVRATHLSVGDKVAMRLLKAADFGGKTIAETAGMPVRLTITGVGVFANDVVPFSDQDALPVLLVMPPLARVPDAQDRAYEVAEIAVKPGTNVEGLRKRVEALAAADPAVSAEPLFVADFAKDGNEVVRGLRPLAVALGLVALVLGLVGALAAGQAVARHVRIGPGVRRALAALGIAGGQRAAIVLVRAAFIGGLGAVASLPVAIVLSPRFPIGVARVAEPTPGVRVDVAVLGLGVLGIVVLITAAALPTAIVAARRERDVVIGRPSRVASVASRAGLRPSVVQGTRFALETGAGPSPVPVRSSLAVAIVGVAAVVTSLTYASSLRGLLDTSARYGQTWDRMVDGNFGPAPVATIVDRLKDDKAVAGLAAGAYGELNVRDQTIPAISFRRLTGAVDLTLLEGRLATARDEVVLGGETARRLGVKVGDVVHGETPTGPATLRVVGRAVFPRFSLGSFATTGLGTGAQLGPDHVKLADESGIQGVPPGFEYESKFWNFVLVNLTPRAFRDGGAARVDGVLSSVGTSDDIVRRYERPTRITDFNRVRDVPLLLSILLACVALVMFAHVLVTSVRARRRELALLAVFGLRRRQLRATVAWQATVAAVVALVVGAPLGLAAGRTIWHSFASGLYIDPTPTTPLIALAVVAAAVLVAANLVAALPGRAASRLRPAVALRTE
jgi:hypothetical protein